MEKKLLLGVVVVVCLCGSAALALDPMGPPAAGHNQSQWSIGAEYSYSDMDLLRTRDRANIRDVIMNKVYLKAGYGISNNWEVFGRVGFADFEYQRATWGSGANWWSGEDNGSYALGMGTKATFRENADTKWGGLAQLSWVNFDGKHANPEASYSPGKFEIDIYEVQIAVGPTHRLGEGIFIYGGPFLHLVDGELMHINSDGDRDNYPIEERSMVGAYIGTQVDITENSVINVEYQLTGDATAISFGFIWML